MIYKCKFVSLDFTTLVRKLTCLPNRHSCITHVKDPQACVKSRRYLCFVKADFSLSLRGLLMLNPGINLNTNEIISNIIEIQFCSTKIWVQPSVLHSGCCLFHDACESLAMM